MDRTILAKPLLLENWLLLFLLRHFCSQVLLITLKEFIPSREDILDIGRSFLSEDFRSTEGSFVSKCSNVW